MDTNRHEPPHEVVGVGVLLLGAQLRGVELSGSQDLQHAVQGLCHRDGAALLRCVDDVYHLGVHRHTGDHLSTGEREQRHTARQIPANAAGVGWGGGVGEEEVELRYLGYWRFYGHGVDPGHRGVPSLRASCHR